MKRDSFKQHKGFTLIELLVVISIIGFLASFAIFALNDARMKARDASRISDIKQIEKAIELYYDDNNQYPDLNYAYTSAAADGCGVRWCELQSKLSAYINKLPVDPFGFQNAFRYYYDSDSGDDFQTYGIMIRLESPGNAGLADNDGGYYSLGDGRYYEMGNQTSYCKQKYAGSNGNWWSSSTELVCVGGN